MRCLKMCSREETSLCGKTIIITGSNVGIGKETARNFVKRGAKVILACRNLNKARRAAEEISTAGPGQAIVYHLDLTSFNSVKSFADNILKSESRIDILINNAAIMTSNKDTTKDGYDLCLQSNYLGPFLLTNLLLDRLKESAPSRIVNLASGFHIYGCMHWDDLNLNQPNSYSMFTAYNQSKLAVVLITRELAVRLQGTGVNTYAVDPGPASSGITRFLPYRWLHGIASFIMGIIFQSATNAARTTIYCASYDETSNETGLYYSNCKLETPGIDALNEESAKKLWKCSVEMIKDHLF